MLSAQRSASRVSRWRRGAGCRRSGRRRCGRWPATGRACRCRRGAPGGARSRRGFPPTTRGRNRRRAGPARADPRCCADRPWTRRRCPARSRSRRRRPSARRPCAAGHRGGEPGDRELAAVRGERRAVHRATGDLPAILGGRLRERRRALRPEDDLDVADLARGAVAIGDGRAVRELHRSSRAAVADALVDELGRTDSIPFDEDGAQLHRPAARSRPPVEKVEPHSGALAHRRDETVFDRRTVLVQRPERLEGPTLVGRAREAHVISVGVGARLLEPPGVERTVRRAHDPGHVGPVREQAGTFADRRGKGPEAAIPAGDANAVPRGRHRFDPGGEEAVPIRHEHRRERPRPRRRPALDPAFGERDRRHRDRRRTGRQRRLVRLVGREGSEAQQNQQRQESARAHRGRILSAGAPSRDPATRCHPRRRPTRRRAGFPTRSRRRRCRSS